VTRHRWSHFRGVTDTAEPFRLCDWDRGNRFNNYTYMISIKPGLIWNYRWEIILVLSCDPVDYVLWGLSSINDTAETVSTVSMTLLRFQTDNASLYLLLKWNIRRTSIPSHIVSLCLAGKSWEWVSELSNRICWLWKQISWRIGHYLWDRFKPLIKGLKGVIDETKWGSHPVTPYLE
jgi:hypothetical protein